MTGAGHDLGKVPRQIGEEMTTSTETTPCDECGTPVDTDIHAEELGMCVECSNKYYDHDGEE
jgi:hypothetical protein